MGRTRKPWADTRLPMEKVEEMWRAYCDKQMATHVARQTNVTLTTAKKYVNVGDPQRDLVSFRKRYSDFRQGYVEADKIHLTDRVRNHEQQTRALRNATFTSLFDRDVGGLTGEATGRARLSDFISMSQYEMDLNRELETREAVDEAEREVIRRVEFSDPAVKAALMAHVRGYVMKNMQAVMRETMLALDPEGQQHLIDRLPVHIRNILEADLDVKVETIEPIVEAVEVETEA